MTSKTFHHSLGLFISAQCFKCAILYSKGLLEISKLKHVFVLNVLLGKSSVKYFLFALKARRKRAQKRMPSSSF